MKVLNAARSGDLSTAAEHFYPTRTRGGACELGQM